jgi:hypothetical protein
MYVDLYRFNQAELATACISVGAWDIDYASCISRSVARLLAPIALQMAQKRLCRSPFEKAK